MTNWTRALGAVIKRQRIDQQVTQGDMARRLGLSQSQYSRIESGHSDPNTLQLRAVCRWLGVDAGALFAQAEREAINS